MITWFKYYFAYQSINVMLMRSIGKKGSPTMKKDGKFNTTKMVELAVLIAVIFIMAFTPLGYIKTPAIEITLIVIPVAVGAVVLGPTAGAVLGLTFGITSLIQSFMSPMGAIMLEVNPIFRVITCIVPRILCGWLTGLVYVALKKGQKTQKLSVVLANLSCPVFNTIFFMSTMMLFYYNTPIVQAMQDTLGVGNPLALIAAIVGVNGVIEAVTCFIVGSAITKALHVVLKIK